MIAMARRRYIGGTSLITGCMDGDCMALDVLEMLQDAFEDIDDAVRNRNLPVRQQRARRDSRAAARARSLRPGSIVRAAPKRKRRVSPYQKEFGRQLKALKKKHPRTPTSKLMKRAHAATKRARRGK